MLYSEINPRHGPKIPKMKYNNYTMQIIKNTTNSLKEMWNDVTALLDTHIRSSTYTNKTA